MIVAEQAMIDMKNMFQKQRNLVKHRPKSQNDIANMSNIQIQNSQDEGLSDNEDEEQKINILYQDIEK